MLQDVADIIVRVGVLLDDPTNSAFDEDYLMPFVDQEYDVLDTELERMGMQYVEGTAVFDVLTGVSDLSSFATGSGTSAGPLATMKVPRKVEWKLQGQQDIYYQPSDRVEELADYDVSSYGAQQWRFAAGNIQVTPSSEVMTLRVRFDQVSTNIYDPTQGVIRGTAHILALRVAEAVAQTRGNDKLQASLGKKGYAAWNAFCTVIGMQAQQKLVVAKSLHRRNRARNVFVASASGAV